MDRARRAGLAVPMLAVLLGASVLALRDSADAADSHERVAAVLVERMDSQAAVREAFAHLEQAIVLRPSSPYAWSALAAARYRAGIPDEIFEIAMRRAAELGPNEPQVQETIVLYGLALGEGGGLATRAAVGKMLAAGLRRDPSAMLRIAERRGRLDAACRRLTRSAVPPQWTRSCGLTGAT
jgi:hypothetical protein